MPAYPLFATLAALAVIAIELSWLRTGVFRRPAYWIAMVVTFAFMIPVDGWMSKLPDPIVVYRPSVLSGLRWPIDIPTEEFVYAFAMVTLAIVLWERADRREQSSRLGGRA